MEQKKSNKTKYILIGLGILVVLFSFGFAGNNGYKYVKELIEKERDINKQQKIESQKIIDSLNVVIDDKVQEANTFQTLWQQAEWRNNRRFKKLKDRIDETKNSNDTSFTNNARVISGTVRRHYQDTIE